MSGAAVERYYVRASHVGVDEYRGSVEEVPCLNGKYVRAKDHDAAIAALTAELQQCRPQWQPIETALKDDRSILVWCPSNRCIFVVSWFDPAKFANGGWNHFGGRGQLHYAPTHWMPLPPAPEAALKERT